MERPVRGRTYPRKEMRGVMRLDEELSLLIEWPGPHPSDRSDLRLGL